MVSSNPYVIFIFTLVLFLYNFKVKRKQFIKELGIKTFKYIPISLQKSIVLSYLRKRNIKDINSLILLNLLYISTICILLKSFKLGYRLRYSTDFLLLMIFIQESTWYKWFSDGNMYYNYAHDFYVYLFIVSSISEMIYFKYKYNKFMIFISLFFVFLMEKNIPITSLYDEKKYKKKSLKKKKNWHKNYFFLQIFSLTGIIISRVKYDIDTHPILKYE